jgi:hypothetical protein
MLRATLLSAVFATGLTTVASAEMLEYHATLNAASEVPPHSVPGTGHVDATLDTTTKALTYTLTFKDLTGPPTMAHFHGPAKVGANAGVAVVIFTGDTPSPVKSTATLTDAQIADLRGGLWYANVHTAVNPGGEIRGQMMPGK